MRPVIILAAILAIPVVSSLPTLHGQQGKQASFSQLPVCFIENRGQMDGQVHYYVQGSTRTLYFTSKGVTYAMNGEGGPERERWCVKLDFIGANPDEKPRGEDRQEAVFSYFKGKTENWKTGIPTYGRLVYEDLWPGIDLVYTGAVNQLKYEFVVKPGADPQKILLAYKGASEVSLKETGALKVTTPDGEFEDGVPYAYQVLEGRKKEVFMRYALQRSGGDVFSYGFELGAYDPDEPLVLDPAMLIYSGYIGGQEIDCGSGIALDSAGNAYVVGYTFSDESSFPDKIGPDRTYNESGDAFVAKVKADGSGLVYCGYIGGEDGEYGNSIAVDSMGNAYVAGETYSDEASFPVKIGPDLTYNGGTGGDAYVAKVNAQGTDLDYCGYIGGDKEDRGCRIKVNSAGNAYVTGWTVSEESSFPVKGGPDLTFNGTFFLFGDAYLAKVESDGSGLVYCGYIGGESADFGYDIAVDSNDNAYVTGWTMSDASSFPVKVGPDLTIKSWDAFVAKVAADGLDLVYCGYIGGQEQDSGNAIAVDDAGNAYVLGDTESSESSFPVKIGPDLTHNGDQDAFLARVNAQGTGLDYCGYIGGEDTERSRDIAMDNKGNLYVTGRTKSNESTFPVKIGPDLTHNGDQDAFLARVNAQGTGLDYCGYIGGTDDEFGMGIAVDDAGYAYVTGKTDSKYGFPTTKGPDLKYNGAGDAFVAKVVRLSLTADTYTLPESTGGQVNFLLDAGPANANRNYILLGSVSGTEPGIPLPGGLATLPLKWDPFTVAVIDLINTNPFKDFLGTLDNQGFGSAELNLPPVPGFAGVTMHFAFTLNNPWDYASNPVGIRIE